MTWPIEEIRKLDLQPQRLDGHHIYLDGKNHAIELLDPADPNAHPSLRMWIGGRNMAPRFKT